MCIKGSAVDLADADGNVGAVVGNPFEVGHHIGKDKTKLDRAFSTLEPFDVVVLQAGIQAVNHLLEWFHFICFFYILIVENGEGQADNIFDCFLTITLMADLVGAPRENVSRACKVLTDRGLIRYGNKRFILTDSDGLAEFYKM